MDKHDPIRLWRVEVVSKYGYRAPYQLIESKLKNVHKEVRNLNLRLLDFPEVWYYQLVDLHKEFNIKRGKWINKKDGQI
jgi:hypothetical protein